MTKLTKQEAEELFNQVMEIKVDNYELDEDELDDEGYPTYTLETTIPLMNALIPADYDLDVRHTDTDGWFLVIYDVNDLDDLADGEIDEDYVFDLGRTYQEVCANLDDIFDTSEALSDEDWYHRIAKQSLPTENARD